jgi:hypothetical protein
MQHDGSGILGLAMVLLAALIALSLIVFWIWMLIDAIKNPELSGTEKIAWVLVILFLNWLGAVVYFFAGRRR